MITAALRLATQHTPVSATPLPFQLTTTLFNAGGLEAVAQLVLEAYGGFDGGGGGGGGGGGLLVSYMRGICRPSILLPIECN